LRRKKSHLRGEIRSVGDDGMMVVGDVMLEPRRLGRGRGGLGVTAYRVLTE
jgi:hypothetical protein